MDNPNFQRTLHRGTDFQLTQDLASALDSGEKVGVIMLESDMSPIERRARDFIESSQLWDDRVLGADEEFVEVCCDPDVYRAMEGLRNDRAEEEEEKLRRVARELRQVVMDTEVDFIVLGAGPSRVGGAVGALTSFAAMERAMLADQIISIDDSESYQMKPSFLDERGSKLRKGAGHHKFKKGKKK